MIGKPRIDLRGPTVAVIAFVALVAPMIVRPTAPAMGWSSLPSSPLGQRQPDVFTPAGRYVLELGGAVHGRPTKNGAAFDLMTRTWHMTSRIPFDVNVAFSTWAWTGRQLFVTDARFPPCKSTPPGPPPVVCLPHAGLYNPATNRWSTTPLPEPLYRLPYPVATWTGRDVVLGGVTVGNPKLEIADYSPVDGRWAMITPRLPPRQSAVSVAAVATSTRLIMWVLWSHLQLKPHPVMHVGVDVLAWRGGHRWRNITGRWPQRQTISAPLFTGTKILVPIGDTPCIAICRQIKVYPGAFADPVTLHRSIIPFSPIDEIQPPYIWTGNAIVEMNEQWYPAPGSRILRDEMVRYNPATRRWRQLPAPPGRPFAATYLVWTGTELLFLTIRGALFVLRPA